jgi:hypothetical protein
VCLQDDSTVHIHKRAAGLKIKAVKDTENRKFHYNIMVTYLMMRYATKDLNSIKKIQQIISETFSEIILTSDKLNQFWTDNLLPHLHNGASAFTQVQNQVIFQLYLTYGRHFWAKLDLQKCFLF